MYKKYYSKFYKENKGHRLWFTAHSHHPWPDCSLEGHLNYWEQSVKTLDKKWEDVFQNILPKFQEQVGKILDIEDHENLVIGQNTQEIVFRVLSSLFPKKIKVLTTDAEYYSWERQASRLEEAEMLERDIIPLEPFETFSERFCKKAQENSYDVIYLSHIFFQSGRTFTGLDELYEATKETKSIVFIDGYHSFFALPFSFRNYADRFIYLAGGYKYAQWGEGVCFAFIPELYHSLRPIFTGWFADFNSLENMPAKVNYGPKFQRFMGSTFDPTGLYRAHRVLSFFAERKISVDTIHHYVLGLQAKLLSRLPAELTEICLNINHKGAHFLSFKTPHAQKIQKNLAQNKIVVDRRLDVFRIGLGLHHDEEDVMALSTFLQKAITGQLSRD